MDASDRKVRYGVFGFFLENCRPPTTTELAAQTGLSPSRVSQSLKTLQRLHHLSLYDDHVPSLTPIAMAHPFSHL